MKMADSSFLFPCVSSHSDQIWVIDNFSAYNQRGNYADSWKFSPDEDCRLKFSLRVHPKGFGPTSGANAITSDDGVFISLRLTNPGEAVDHEVTVQYKLSFLGADGEAKYIKDSRAKYIYGKCIWGSPEYFARDFVLNPDNGVLVNDKMIIRYEINLLQNGVIPSKPFCVNTLIDEASTKILDDFSRLLQSGTLSDVKLVVEIEGEETKQFSVHKSILSARSPIFASMFSHNTTEQTENMAKIIDIKADVLEHMLSYVYTGKVCKLDQFAEGLFVAADKYELDLLKNICEESLCTNLTIDSVSNLLLLADMHSAPKLKSRAIKFINAHASEVMNLPEFESIRKELLLEIYRNLVEELDKKTDADKIVKTKKI